MLSKWLSIGTRWFLAGVFIYASVDKIFHPAAFARSIYNYQILPDWMINFAALVLPWLELLLGLCLVTKIWLPGTLLLCNGLLWVFMGALVYNYWRGLNIHCGCFSSGQEENGAAPMLWYLTRDIFFLLVGGYLMYSHIIKGGNHVEKDN